MVKEKVKPNWSDPATTAENEKLPRYLKWAWTSRGVALAVNVILLMQLTYYCTDILGMSAVLVGTLLLVSKLVDGFTDLCVGFLIDRTSTKWGKARPYEICIVLVWIFTIMLFSAPASGTVVQSIYILVLYALINSVCATCLNGGDAVYLARSIRSEKNRVSIMSFNGGIIMVFSIVISMVLPQLIAGIGTTRSGWTLIACMIGIPMGLIGMLRFVFVKEVAAPAETRQPEEAKRESVPFKTGVACAFKNKYIWIVAGMTFVVQLSSNIGSAVNTYYFKYIMGNIGLATLVSMTSLITPFIMIIFPVVSRKLGMGGVLKLVAVMGVIGYAIRTIGGTNMVTLMIGSVIGSVAVLPISMMVSIYMIDCMDYGEWHTGVRVEGILSSVNSFLSKLGSGIASSLVGIIMGLAGYDGTLEVQSAAANTSIVALFNWVPLILMVALLLLAIAYKLDKQIPQIREELAKKRAQA